MLNGLDLFSGIGGITLALSDYVRPVAYCEIEPYCQSILLSRMHEGNLPKAPIWDDVRTLPYEKLPRIDITTAGFPCQDISVAGHGKGLEGERSGLFFEIMRLAEEIKPKFLFLENVPAITGRGGLRVVREITSLGYDCRWCVISAASIGALHRRERWFLLGYAEHYGSLEASDWRAHEQEFTTREREWIDTKAIWESERTDSLSQYVADSHGKGLEGQWRGTECEEEKQSKFAYCSEDDSNANSISSREADPTPFSKHVKLKTWGKHAGFYWPFESRDDWQKTVSEMGKCTDGLPYQVDRLKALGNSVVPIQVKESFKLLFGAK